MRRGIGILSHGSSSFFCAIAINWMRFVPQNQVILLSHSIAHRLLYAARSSPCGVEASRRLGSVDRTSTIKTAVQSHETRRTPVSASPRDSSHLRLTHTPRFHLAERRRFLFRGFFWLFWRRFALGGFGPRGLQVPIHRLPREQLQRVQRILGVGSCVLGRRRRSRLRWRGRRLDDLVEIGLEFDGQSDRRGGGCGLRSELKGGGGGDDGGLLWRRRNGRRSGGGGGKRRRERGECVIFESVVKRRDGIEILE